MVALYRKRRAKLQRRPIVRDVMKAYFDKKARVAKDRSQLTREFRPLLPVPLAAPAALALGRRVRADVHLRILRGIDWYLLAITLVICAFGILQIYSATHGTKWQDAWWKQIVFVPAGLC